MKMLIASLLMVSSAAIASSGDKIYDKVLSECVSEKVKYNHTTQAYEQCSETQVCTPGYKTDYNTGVTKFWASCQEVAPAQSGN
ncbi:hypothetical protein [Bdellovibrio sp. HCB209]|uniref:hypothetical protein n=1 Tax=Bdellovibrio sp. HCB209 TaxID=3394354 RepID=UPI0039B69C95